jgi:large subunit ribosomal protein L4
MDMNANIYTKDGTAAGTISVPDTVFGVTWNADLVHEVVVGMQGNARAGTANTKDRSEVRGGGKKPWKQKGTGRARHGSRRSPIWVGGGIAHGPRSEKDFSVKINKKVRQKALAVVLSKKFADAEVIFVDSLTMNEPKTAIAKTIIGALAKGSGSELLARKRKNAAVILLPTRQAATEKSFQNFSNIEVVQIKDVNPVDLLTYKYVIVAEPTSALEQLARRVGADRNPAS